MATLYGPVFAALDAYLASLGGGACSFDFELIYFNSSSAKAMMTLLDKLEEAATQGAAVTINWHYDEEDDTMRELGEEFGEDLKHAKFRLEKMVVGGMSFDLFEHEEEVIARGRVGGSRRVKGVAHPVIVYEVIDPIEHIDPANRPLNAETPYLRLELDPRRMTMDEQRDARRLLREALGRLSSKGSDEPPKRARRSANTEPPAPPASRP